MWSLLVNVLGPVVALVAIGALAGPRLGIDAGSLAKLAYWVLGPAFAFSALTQAELAVGLVGRVILAALAGCVVAALLAWALSRSKGSNYEETACTVMTATYGNVGNTGLAIVVFALGEQALGLASVLMITINLIGMTLAIALASGQRHTAWSAMAQALIAPMTLGAIAAVIFVIIDRNTSGGIELPLLLGRAVDLLAEGLIPVMLFTLGMQLVDGGSLSLSSDVAVSALAKLMVAPAVAAAAAMALGLTGDALGAVVIQSAMPPAVFCAVVAIEHDLNPKRVTNSVVVLTVLSLLTLPVVLTLVS